MRFQSKQELMTYIEEVGWEGYDWENHTPEIINYLPEKFDPDKANWVEASLMIPALAPQLFDPDRFDWCSSKAVGRLLYYLPEKFDPDRILLYCWSLEILEDIQKHPEFKKEIPAIVKLLFKLGKAWCLFRKFLEQDWCRRFNYISWKDL